MCLPQHNTIQPTFQRTLSFHCRPGRLAVEGNTGQCRDRVLVCRRRLGSTILHIEPIGSQGTSDTVLWSQSIVPSLSTCVSPSLHHKIHHSSNDGQATRTTRIATFAMLETVDGGGSHLRVRGSGSPSWFTWHV